MPTIHFLNVGDGDCSVIQHFSGNTTVIDVNLAKPSVVTKQALMTIEELLKILQKTSDNTLGNYNQKDNPENPVEYLLTHNINSIFRFILTHPDKDHLGGLKCFFEQFSPINFWDIDNNKDGEDDDWTYYKELKQDKHSKRLLLYSGSNGPFYNENDKAERGGDGLTILSPIRELVTEANAIGDYNDASYTILYSTCNFKILFAGDGHDKTWSHILYEYKDLVSNIDVLIAPHHGRDSDRNFDFLDILKPKITLFGNAPSEYLAYEAWSKRNLAKFTNNQCGNIVLNIINDMIYFYISNEKFARDINSYTYFSEGLGWYIRYLEALI